MAKSMVGNSAESKQGNENAVHSKTKCNSSSRSRRLSCEPKEDKGGFWAIALFAVAHRLCCGIPLLILSGVSLAFLRDRWPVFAIILAVVGVIGFIWYLKRGCATCPRNEDLCLGGRCERNPHGG